ncbi:MAG: hypothetical protein HZB34_05280 [Nitrospirae bacterium]|nr:hypothetical protein [Nitrospirota bacterium]
MSMIRVIGVCLSLLLTSGFLSAAWATHDDIHVKMQNTVQNCPGGAGACKTEFILSNSSCTPTASNACPKTHTVGNDQIIIKVKDYTYGHAKVKATDSTNDTLALQNAIIVPQTTVFDYHLEFWRSYHKPPTPTAGTPKKFKTTANGTLTRPGNYCTGTTTSAGGDTIKFSGFVNANEVGTQQSHNGGTNDCATVNISETTEETYASLPDPRDMKADLWFTMQANDELMFTASAGYKVFSTSTGGDEDPPCNEFCMEILGALAEAVKWEKVPSDSILKLPKDSQDVIKELELRVKEASERSHDKNPK